jgi:hypothetical protein
VKVTGAHLRANWLSGKRWTVADHIFEPLRHADIELIRVWRNEQLDVLRQSAPIDPPAQESWFRESVVPTHASSDPEFILVSVQTQGRMVAYGGLTNIEWSNRRAEVSYLADTRRARDSACYAADFKTFLDWLVRLAFRDLNLNRLFTETYAHRIAHTRILEEHGFVLEGIMRAHTIKDGNLIDSLLHGRLK